MALAEDKELHEFRALMEAPDEYAEGFGWRTYFGAAFIGFIMMPGSIYLGLVAGQSMGPAAEWTTIILFTELARRSFQVLSKQEIYVLYYIAGGLTAMIGVVALSGGAFADLVWKQFLRASAPGGYGEQVPDWVAPGPDSPAVLARTFWHADWLPAIAVLLATQLLSRVAWLSFGYTLFRITSDGEQLPFPMAPIAAQGATALAETSSKQETWRWRVFSVGTMIGLGFGLIYVGVPTLSNVMLVKPVAILPIPWIDFTQGTERFLPGAPTGISTDLGTVFVGFVLPFWMVVGSAIAAGCTLVINPILQVTGHLPTWLPGMETTRTAWAASIDVWLSFGIGTAFAVACIGFYKIARSWMEAGGPGVRGVGFGAPPAGRGDVDVKWPILLFLVATTGYVVLCRILVPDFPIWFVIIYGYIWTPLQSYINARMVGLTGQFVGFPMIREATFIFSGYKGVDIWFAPIPLANYGATAQRFREVELTGTRFTSVVKAEVLMFPILGLRVAPQSHPVGRVPVHTEVLGLPSAAAVALVLLDDRGRQPGDVPARHQAACHGHRSDLRTGLLWPANAARMARHAHLRVHTRPGAVPAHHSAPGCRGAPGSLLLRTTVRRGPVATLYAGSGRGVLVWDRTGRHAGHRLRPRVPVRLPDAVLTAGTTVAVHNQQPDTLT